MDDLFKNEPAAPLAEALRPRTIAYLLIWSSIGAAMLFALGTRTRLDISAQQDRNPVSVRLSDGTIRNSFTIKIRNMESRPRAMEIGIEGLAGAVLWTGGARPAHARAMRLIVPADSVAKQRIFLGTAQPGEIREPFAFTVRALDEEGGTSREAAQFERPETSP